MLNWQGHVKLVDFGLSKCLPDKNQMTHSFLGSNGYMSPEINMKKGHNYLNDVYNLGIFMYDLLHGFLPFETQKFKRATENNINAIHGNIIFKDGLSSEGKDLLKRLLSIKPENRLGGETDVISILYHPWFLSYRKYVNSETAPDPIFTPDLSHDNFDTSLNNHLDQLIKEVEGR